MVQFHPRLHQFNDGSRAVEVRKHAPSPIYMSEIEVNSRNSWQENSGIKAAAAETRFFDIMTKAFEGTDFKIRSKPKEFKNIYSKLPLDPLTLVGIYTPTKAWKHGIVPDYAIDNIKTGKTLYVEVKRQDGWVEGKESKAGRGNAHERLCRLFSTGLLKTLRLQGKIDSSALPFWAVLQGDITRDPKRVREIYLWFDEHSDHIFLWSDLKND